MSLKKQAEDLGIKVDGRWNDERIQEEIDAVLNARAQAESLEKSRAEAEAKEKADAEEAAKVQAEAEKKAERAERERIEREVKAQAEAKAQLKALEEEQADQSVTVKSLQGNPMRSLGLEAFGEVTIPGHVAAEPRMALKIQRARDLGLIQVK